MQPAKRPAGKNMVVVLRNRDASAGHMMWKRLAHDRRWDLKLYVIRKDFARVV